MEAMTSPAGDGYPVRMEVRHKDKLSRLSTGFRIILAIPLLIAVAVIGGGFPAWGLPAGIGFGFASGIIAFHWITVLVRGRPVRWVFDVIVAIQRFIYRSYTYFFLLNDRYPPFEGEWETTYEVEMPERISRWRLFIWKTISAVPHFLALAVVSFAVAVVVFIGWFAVLFTGTFPRGLHDFVAGWLRWSARVSAYWMSLTDEFPAFGFSPEIGRAQQSTYVISCVAGVIVLIAAIGGGATLIAYPVDTDEVTVAYGDLLNEEGSEPVEIQHFSIFVGAANDDYVVEGGLLEPAIGNRFVLFTLPVFNGSTVDRLIEANDFRVKDSEGERHRPVLATINGLEAPEVVESGDLAVVTALFEVDEDATPVELTYDPSFGFKKRAKFIIE
jgi:hypothetical protein